MNFLNNLRNSGNSNKKIIKKLKFNQIKNFEEKENFESCRKFDLIKNFQKISSNLKKNQKFQTLRKNQNFQNLKKFIN